MTIEKMFPESCAMLGSTVDSYSCISPTSSLACRASLLICLRRQETERRGFITDDCVFLFYEGLHA